MARNLMTLRGSVEDTRTVLEVKLVNAGSIVYSAHRRRCLEKLSSAEFAFPAGASHHRDVMIQFGLTVCGSGSFQY